MLTFHLNTTRTGGHGYNNNDTITTIISPECDHPATVTDINTKQAKEQ